MNMNDTYQKFCNEYNLSNKLKIGELSDESIKLLKRFLIQQRENDIIEFLLWVIDFHYKLSDDIDEIVKKSNKRTGDFLCSKEFSNYQDDVWCLVPSPWMVR